MREKIIVRMVWMCGRKREQEVDVRVPRETDRRDGTP